MPTLMQNKKQVEDRRRGRMGYAKSLMQNHGWTVNAGPDRLSFVLTAPDCRVFNFWPATGDWVTARDVLPFTSGCGIHPLIKEGGGSDG